MLCLGEQLTGCHHQRIGLGVQLPTTALLDLGCACASPAKKGSSYSRTLESVWHPIYLLLS